MSFRSPAVILCLLLPAPAIAQEKGDAAALRKAAEAAWADQDFAKAAEVLTKLAKIDKDDGVVWHRLGYSLHALKKYDAALEAHMRAARSKVPQIKQLGTYNTACVYAIQKDKEKAFAWLNKAVDAGFKNASQFKTDPDMDNLRSDPRFKKLMGRLSDVAEESPIQVYNYSSARQSTRATYFAGNSSPGQLAIDYGAPRWQEKHGAAIDDKKFINRRWRFGANFWTTLDTNIPLTISGQEIAAGSYYLTLTHKGNREFVMNVLDPATVRKYRIDPYVAHLTKGGTDVELDHSEVDDVAEKLAIAIEVNKQKPGKGALVIRFGPHKLTAKMKIHLAQ